MSDSPGDSRFDYLGEAGEPDTDQKSVSRPEKSAFPASSRGGVLKVLGLMALLWAAIQVIWFWRTNISLFHQGERRPLGVFSGLFTTDWSFSLANTPPAELLVAVLTAGLTTVLGILALRAFEIRLRSRLAIALGFTVGLGLSGIVFEFVIMAGALKLPFVLIAWTCLFAAFGIILAGQRRAPVWRWWGRRPGDPQRLVPVLDKPGQVRRDLISTFGPSQDEIPTMHRPERVVWWVLFSLIVLMTLAIFWHAVFYPETYWDSLILYLGYARMTFLEGGFPIKVAGQVGIGLGANYPHMFSNYGAAASTMAGGWSDLPLRFVAPFAATLAVILVYDAILAATGRRIVAMAGALLFRAVPLGIAYSTYASNYSFAILFTAALLYTAVLFARTRLPGVFVLLTFIPAAAMHVNYLMGILWVPWFVAVLCGMRRRKAASHGSIHREEVDYGTEIYDFLGDDETQSEEKDHGASRMELSAGDAVCIGTLLKSRVFYSTVIVCMFLGSTWYVRNWVVTGNPVYAFFPGIFTTTRNYNPEVMESAGLEWFRNGDGIGRLAEQFADYDAGRSFRNQDSENFQREATLRHRLMASWLYWQGFETFRIDAAGSPKGGRGFLADRLFYLLDVDDFALERPDRASNPFHDSIAFLHSSHAYKAAPLVLGFMFPGIMLGLLLLLFRRSAIAQEMEPEHGVCYSTLYWSSLAVLTCMLGYHYLIADLYLYQIIPFLVPAAILGSFPVLAWHRAESAIESVLEVFGGILLVAVALVPGLSMSLMNFKTPGGGYADSVPYNAAALDIFRRPGMDRDTFYTIRYGDDVRMWHTVSSLLENEPLLTHDNRHLMYDPSIELVHLDDWDVQQVWDSPTGEKRDFFRSRGIRYYLRIPNESAHPVNRRAGMDELIQDGTLELVERFGRNELYRFVQQAENKE